MAPRRTLAFLLGCRDGVFSEDLERFQGTFTLCIAFCVVGIVLCAIAFIADRAFWGIFALEVPFFSSCIIGRLYAAFCADQRQAVVSFGRVWLLATLAGCGSFVLLNKYHHFCEDVSLMPACCLALLTALVPTYLKFMGVQLGIRILSCASIWLAYHLSPRWTQMPHAHAQLLMTMAMLAGEAAGNGLVLLFRAPTSGVAELSVLDDAVSTSPLDSTPGLSSDMPRPTEQTGHDASASQKSEAAGFSLADILSLGISAVRINPVTLQFEPPQVQAHYRAHKFAGSSGRHAASCAFGVCLSIALAISSAEELLVGGVCASFYLTLLTVNSIICEQRLHAERAMLLLGRAWVSAFAFWSTFFAALQPQMQHVVDAGHTGSFVCLGICSVMLPAQLRLLMVEHEMAVKGLAFTFLPATYLLGLDSYLASGLRYLSPDGVVDPPPSCADGSMHAYYTLLTMLPALVIGELIAYSIKSVEMMAHVRFLKASKLTAVAEERAKAAEEAMLAEMATVQRLEAQNAIDARNRLADSRLNHVIKGHCGTAVSSLVTFIQMLPPYLLSPLPPHVQRFISAPIEQLGIVIHWSQRRQMLIQQEEGTYVSVRTPTNVEEVLESTLGNGGVVDADPAVRALSIDEGVLRLVLDEALINARKYGRDGSVVVSASFSGDSLHVTVSNANKEGVPRRSAEEWAQALLPRLRSPGVVTKDVIGLPSIAKAVEQAHGAVVLSSELRDEQEHTLLRLTLPALIASSDDANATGPAKAVCNSVLHDLDQVPSFLRNGRRRRVLCADGECVCASDESEASDVDVIAVEKKSCAPSLGVKMACARDDDSSFSRKPLCDDSSFSRKSLFCLGIDDTWQPRMLHKVLFDNYLRADMRLSGSLDGSTGQLHAFFFVALGVLDKELHLIPSEVPVRQADVILLPEKFCTVDGVSVAKTLRGCGFRNIICLVSESSAESKVHKARADLPFLDLVFDPNSSLEGMAAQILDLVSRNALAPPAPPLHSSPTSSTSSFRTKSKLVCASIDDEEVPRMMLQILIERYLGADMRYSCAVGASIEQQRAFADIALGLVDAELRPLAERRVVDVVVLDENINLSVSPPILGSNLIKELRARGFKGVTCIITGESVERVAQLQKQPSIDIVVEKGTPLRQLAEQIIRCSLEAGDKLSSVIDDEHAA